MKRLSQGRKRVVVAMSGGVDSSTVAGLLVEAGHEVIGMMMKLYDRSDLPEAGEGEGACCSLDDALDARRVADHLGIPFYVGNYRDAFRKGVIDPFIGAYLEGETPNPCVRCNDTVKFRPLLARARALGADVLATGHYARTEVQEDGHVALFAGRSPDKDQSYFLAGIGQKALDRVVFPLGDMTKDAVRAEAERLGLPVANKPESQDICFIPDGDYAAFLGREAGDRLPKAGPIVSLDGLSLGRHQGIHRFTPGQRKGLGISAPERQYVVAVRPEDGAVVVGPQSALAQTDLLARRARWLGPMPAEGSAVTVRIRHRDRGAPATLLSAPEGMIRVRLARPAFAASPGQQMVLYHGDRVLAAATLTRPEPVAISTAASSPSMTEPAHVGS